LASLYTWAQSLGSRGDKGEGPFSSTSMFGRSCTGELSCPATGLVGLLRQWSGGGKRFACFEVRWVRWCAFVWEKVEAAETMEGRGSLWGVKLRPGASCRCNPPLGFLIWLKWYCFKC
jgi:hypothetical protein